MTPVWSRQSVVAKDSRLLNRIAAVARKEFIQVIRDRRTLAIQLMIPLIQLFLFGYAINMNVEDIPTVIADQSGDRASRAYLDALLVSGYFDIRSSVCCEAEVTRALDRGRARVGVVIPPDFADRVGRADAQVLFMIDGSDLFTSLSAYNAANLVHQAHASEELLAQLARQGQPMLGDSLLPIETRARILYNPNLDDLWFVIPGMLAMLMQTQTVTLTAAAVVRERETGTIEQLLVTPIRRLELLVGKLLPNVLIAMANVLTIVGLGVCWFGVPFRGSVWLFLWMVLLYVISGLGLGLLVSTVAQNQRQSQQIVLLTALVGLVLGGFMFPRYTMPPALALIGDLFPMTHFIPIARGIVSKGVDLRFLWRHVLALAIHIGVILLAATRAFRRALD
jgi:ABC-2 type transport system permease protein